MPIKKSAIKHMRQTKKLTAQNKSVKNRVRDAMKAARKAIDAKDKSAAQTAVQKAVKQLDQAAQNKVFKKNTVARYKSRLMQALNKLT